MYYLYLCLCTSAKCMSVELKQFEKIFSFDHMTSSFQCPSVYRQTRYTAPNYRLHRRWRFNEGALYIDYPNLEDLKGSRFYTIMIIQIYYTSAFFFYMKF